MMPSPPSRRRFLAAAAAGALGLASRRPSLLADEAGALAGKALIAITLDLEMSRNFPRWEDTHWDYEKGNLDAATKEYTLRAARRAGERGGKLHCFVVGRVLEQENVDWLLELLRQGHALGNHTYDHVNVKGARPAEIQHRFRRAPWLVHGKRPEEIIAENIRLTAMAMKERLGTVAAGFRTPGGFQDGLADRADLQELLLGLGLEWVSSKYPAHPVGKAGEEPPPAVYDGIVAAQGSAQPFVYPSGLVEVPMSPISDITAFRGGRWRLEHFLEALRRTVAWVIERRAVFDFLGHPSCLSVVDPELKAVDLICDLVRDAGGRATFADLGAIAGRAAKRS
jgi:hypothetical protein